MSTPFLPIPSVCFSSHPEKTFETDLLLFSKFSYPSMGPPHVRSRQRAHRPPCPTFPWDSYPKSTTSAEWAQHELDIGRFKVSREAWYIQHHLLSHYFLISCSLYYNFPHLLVPIRLRLVWCVARQLFRRACGKVCILLLSAPGRFSNFLCWLTLKAAQLSP